MQFPSPGLRSGLSLHLIPDDPGLRCRPSSLYTFPADFLPGLARDCHAKEVSPILSSFASPVSRRALKFSQVRCVCHSATPAWPSYDRARCLILNILITNQADLRSLTKGGLSR